MSAIAMNIRNLQIQPMTAEETATTSATYGEAISFTNRFMSFTDTPKQNSGSLYGDGAKTNSFVSKDGGELQLNIQKFLANERVSLFNETQESDNTVSMGKNDVVPYVSVAFEVENDDGTIDLHKYPKVKFAEQATTVTQKDEKGGTYSTMQLKGEYIFDLKDNKARYIKENMSPVSDAAEIAAWFASGDFAAYSETLKALTVSSAAGTTSGTTKVTVSPAIASGRSYVYKTDATVTAPVLNDVLNGWSSWDGIADITATTGNKIGIAEIDAELKCKAYGYATVTSKA